eukprot:646483-Rhodomonas_salina.1
MHYVSTEEQYRTQAPPYAMSVSDKGTGHHHTLSEYGHHTLSEYGVWSTDTFRYHTLDPKP